MKTSWQSNNKKNPRAGYEQDQKALRLTVATCRTADSVVDFTVFAVGDRHRRCFPGGHRDELDQLAPAPYKQ